VSVRRWLAFTVGLLLGLMWADVLHAQRSHAVTDGVTAPAWMFDVTYVAAASAGYGALRLARVRPTPAAAATASVNILLHVRGWLRGEYRPSMDWAFDFTTRGGPAIALAVCEVKGRKACAVALGVLAASYVALMPNASP
jgi:hypothetical protein